MPPTVLSPNEFEAGVSDADTIERRSLISPGLDTLHTTPRPFGARVQSAAGHVYQLILAQPPPWFVPVASSLLDLLRLPTEWNSYAARPISPRAARAALELLVETMEPDTPHPSVVPMSRGDIQLEWHLRGLDIEVVVSADGPIRVWYEDLRGGTERELTLAEGSEPLREVLRELAARS